MTTADLSINDVTREVATALRWNENPRGVQNLDRDEGRIVPIFRPTVGASLLQDPVENVWQLGGSAEAVK
jgi:hypothetical protein